MKLVDKTRTFDSQRMFKGKYKKCDVIIYYSASSIRKEVPYWYYTFNKKGEDCRYNSLWENMKYSTQEECVTACENKINELVKQQKKKRTKGRESEILEK